jgi:hypothetical protein
MFVGEMCTQRINEERAEFTSFYVTEAITALFLFFEALRMVFD